MDKELQYYYVHGLASSKNAVKFKEIQIRYPNAICFEWTVKDNLTDKINEWVAIIKESKTNNILIGSSTGCNFICQMNIILQKSNNHPKTILLNLLLSLDQVINKEIIPEQLIKYIRETDHFCNYLLVISDNDEILDHSIISPKILQSNRIIISKDDNHQLLKFKKYFRRI